MQYDANLLKFFRYFLFRAWFILLLNKTMGYLVCIRCKVTESRVLKSRINIRAVGDFFCFIRTLIWNQART